MILIGTVSHYCSNESLVLRSTGCHRVNQHIFLVLISSSVNSLYPKNFRNNAFNPLLHFSCSSVRPETTSDFKLAWSSRSDLCIKIKIIICSPSFGQQAHCFNRYILFAAMATMFNYLANLP